MSEFNGLVLYKPSEGVKCELRQLILHINSNKPDITAIYEKYTTKRLFFKVVDYTSIEKEANSFIGWCYTTKLRWVVSVEDVLSMLLVNDECYITPSQVRSLSKAVELLL